MKINECSSRLWCSHIVIGWLCFCQGREAPLVLLLFNAGPLDVTFAQESPEVDAIMACGYPAQATGEALYRVLTGTGPHSVPAGRLPATWPAQLNQVTVFSSKDSVCLFCQKNYFNAACLVRST